VEIQESERRACAQADLLKHALDEHNLELRVKAANEAEAACQQRLAAAEAEIADLRVRLDATERFELHIIYLRVAFIKGISVSHWGDVIL